MRKVFLDDLPKIKINGERINWQKCINRKVKFIYDDIEDEVKILRYNNQTRMVTIEFKNISVQIYTSNFKKCQLGQLLGKYNKFFTYNVGDVITNFTILRKIKIVQQIIIKIKSNKNIRGYKYKCLICGNEDDIRESDLIGNKGCNVCSGNKVLKGYNDLWTTHPHIAKLLKYPERGYQISFGCNSKELFICPLCQHEKSIYVYSIVNQGLGCQKCSDGISYPNKFGFTFLEQIKKLNGIKDFETEKPFDWLMYKFKGKLCKGFIDFYFEINSKEYGLEMDGGFHTKDNKMTGQTKEESKYIDDEKDRLCKEHEVEIIRINCEESTLNWIKNSIMNSKPNLPKLLSFKEKDIDWLECHKFACNNLVKIVCDYWNDGIKNSLEIAIKLKLSKVTVIRYLKQGAELGWCNYDPKEMMKIRGFALGKNSAKK